MESRFERQMKKGVLEMLVLSLLCRHPAHGYQLLGEIASQSQGFLQLKEGTLYPILYRLEDDGLIQASWDAEGRSAPKKVYTPTDQGREELARQRQVWKEFCACVARFDQDEGGTRP